MTSRTTSLITLPADEIEGLVWEPLPQIGSAVRHKVLWRTGDSLVGIMEIGVGGRVELHAHQQAHHHLWITEGSVAVLGTVLGPGSYAHVPAGVDHDLVNAGVGVCRFLYTYLKP